MIYVFHTCFPPWGVSGLLLPPPPLQLTHSLIDLQMKVVFDTVGPCRAPHPLGVYSMYGKGRGGDR